MIEEMIGAIMIEEIAEMTEEAAAAVERKINVKLFFQSPGGRGLAIEERPVAVNGQVVIRPMMYTALSYDHRIVDGREAVQFLVRVKELIEDPALFLLD